MGLFRTRKISKKSMVVNQHLQRLGGSRVGSEKIAST